MVDIMELPKARINASMLPQYIDRPVCFVGRLEKVRAGSGERTGPGPLGKGCGVGSGGWEQVTFKQHCLPVCCSFHNKSLWKLLSLCSSILVPLLLCPQNCFE